MLCLNCGAALLTGARFCHVCGGCVIPAKKPDMTMKEIYDRWLPLHQKRVGPETIYDYQAAFKWFSTLHHTALSEIGIDDLQACMDSCPRGKRTKENMKAMAGLLYKWAIPRNQAKINMAQYLVIDAPQSLHHNGIPVQDLPKLWRTLPYSYYARLILAQCYLGFRPTEFLALRVENLDRAEMVLVGGGKTAAGTNRVVTISPRIQRLVLEQVAGRTSGQIFCREDLGFLRLKQYREEFYKVLRQAGIENPVGADGRRKYTPHSCRHTFATLIKNAPGAEKDKLELIGHTTGEMLRYYQDVNLADLRKITDAI